MSLCLFYAALKNSMYIMFLLGHKEGFSLQHVSPSLQITYCMHIGNKESPSWTWWSTLRLSIYMASSSYSTSSSSARLRQPAQGRLLWAKDPMTSTEKGGNDQENSEKENHKAWQGQNTDPQSH